MATVNRFIFQCCFKMNIKQLLEFGDLQCLSFCSRTDFTVVLQLMAETRAMLIDNSPWIFCVSAHLLTVFVPDSLFKVAYIANSFVNIKVVSSFRQSKFICFSGY